MVYIIMIIIDTKLPIEIIDDHLGHLTDSYYDQFSVAIAYSNLVSTSILVYLLSTIASLRLVLEYLLSN
jgi:hypothetical protein